MPELPEVEAARRAIQEHCCGKKIKRAVVADDPKVIEGVSPSEFQVSLLGKTIVSAHRKGKNMWLQLDSPPYPSFQFGMAGAVYIKGVAVTKYRRSAVNDSDEWPSKYSKLFMELDDGLELSFTDKRRFAKVRLLEDPTSVSPISELGPDALLELRPLEEFVDSIHKKKISIKALLLDQGFISGIGNWIADEVLYQARIHPLQPASTLSKESCEALHKCIKEVIKYAVQVDADCSRFPTEWMFHFRWGKKPGEVNGKKIDFITAGGRTSAYVPELQNLTGASSGKAPSKQRKQSNKNRDRENPASGEESDEETVKPKKAKTSTKMSSKPLAKRKSKASHGNNGDDNVDSGDDDDDDGGRQKKGVKAVKQKKARVEKKTSLKVLKTSKKSAERRKKAK